MERGCFCKRDPLPFCVWQGSYQGGETTDGRRCYVGNINYEIREDEVRNAFNEFGQITKMSYKQGYAFIDYADKRDAEVPGDCPARSPALP